MNNKFSSLVYISTIRMSQSDYIRHKRVATELKSVLGPNIKTVKNSDGVTVKFQTPPVFDAEDYIEYKEYTLDNTIKNTKVCYSKLNTPGKQEIFDMTLDVSNCPVFPECKNTNSRPNRVPMSQVYFTPTQPSKYINNPTNVNYSQANKCKCKTSRVLLGTYPQFNKPSDVSISTSSLQRCICNTYPKHVRTKICDACTNSFASSNKAIKTDTNLWQGSRTVPPYKLPNSQYPVKKPANPSPIDIWGFTLHHR